MPVASRINDWLLTKIDNQNLMIEKLMKNKNALLSLMKNKTN